MINPYKTITVYIAGPYSEPDQAINVKVAMDAAHELLCYGLVPYCPHLTHFLHMAYPRSWKEWMEYDEVWLRKCDCVLRLIGVSRGADREVDLAVSLEIPVFNNLPELLNWVGEEHRKAQLDGWHHGG